MIVCIWAITAAAFSVPRPSIKASIFACSRRSVSSNQTGRNIRAGLGPLAKVGDELADDHAGRHRLGHRVAAQAVKAVMSQQAASPAENNPFKVGLSPVWLVRTPPMV